MTLVNQAKDMDLFDLDVRLSKLPRTSIGFYPTPFHRLHNLSAAYGVNFFLKREDLAGPGTISGSKTRLAEFSTAHGLAAMISTAASGLGAR